VSYIVELEPGVWLAPLHGRRVPGQTLTEADAKRFSSMKAAAKALTAARSYRPFKSAVITGG